MGTAPMPAAVPIHDFDTFLVNTRRPDQLSRMQQQLLQAISRPLPLFLLQTALQCGGGCPAVTQAAARAAWCCLPCWILPGLGVSPASTTGAGAPSSAQLLPLGPVVDCWQLLMKQQLLEQPAALLPMAAASAQQLPGDSMQAQQLFSSRPCSCAGVPYALQEGSSAGLTDHSSSTPLACMTADCILLLTISELLALLQPLSLVPCGAASRVWNGPLKGRLLMLLEILARRVLSCNVICSSSSSSSSVACSAYSSSSTSIVGTATFRSMGSHHLAGNFKQAINCLFRAVWPYLPPGTSPTLQSLPRLFQESPTGPPSQGLPAMAGFLSASMQELQQLQGLHQQFCSLAASCLKLSCSQRYDSRLLSLAGSDLLAAACRTAAAQAYYLPPQASLADVRELLTPWMVLLGRHLREIGSAVQYLRIHTAEALGMATVPLSTSSSADSTSPEAGSDPGSALPYIASAASLIAAVQALLQDATDIGSCFQEISQAWAGFSQSGGTVTAASSSSSTSNDLLNAQVAYYAVLPGKTMSSSSMLLHSSSSAAADIRCSSSPRDQSPTGAKSEARLKAPPAACGQQQQQAPAPPAATGSLRDGTTGGSVINSSRSDLQPAFDSFHSLLEAAGATVTVSVGRSADLQRFVDKHLCDLYRQAAANGAQKPAAVQCQPPSTLQRPCDGSGGSGKPSVPDSSDSSSTSSSISNSAGSSSSSRASGSRLLRLSGVGTRRDGSSSSNINSMSATSAQTVSAAVPGGGPSGQCTAAEPCWTCRASAERWIADADSTTLPPAHTEGLDADRSACLSATTPAECLRSFLAAGLWQQVCQQLQEVGTALCNALPVPWLCNNPGCTNMAGSSELQLVGGRSCVCGGCRVAR